MTGLHGLYNIDCIIDFYDIIIGKCKYPVPGDDMATFLSHTEGPLIEGSNITYNCSPGLKVIESNMSTCMNNGQWEPDPMDITCTGNYTYNYNYTMHLEYSACDGCMQ